MKKMLGSEKRKSARRRARFAAVLGSVAATLVTAPALGYRTGEDSPPLAGRGRVAWPASDIGFFLSNSALPSRVTREQMETALASSLDAWATSECSSIKPFFAGWTENLPLTKDGQNTIAWTRDWAKLGFPSGVPGNTDMQYRGHDDRWDIAEADVYLDASSYDWTTTAGEDTSVQAVLTHELGHALGLLHPCEPGGEDDAPACERVSKEVEATAMYPYYSSSQTALSEDDSAGLCYLYPRTEPCSCGLDETCLDGECRAMCGETLCEKGQVCGAWGCIDSGTCADQDCRGQSCENDAACGPLALCKEGICATGSRSWGDRCEVSSDCTNGACIDGVCEPTCTSDSECGPLGSCTPTADESAAGCIASGAYELGMHCNAGDDCRSGICIFAEGGNFCTTRCPSRMSCPSDWSCEEVERRDVCVPPYFVATGGGGCSMSAPPGDAGRPLAGWLISAAAIASVLRTRRSRLNKA